MIYLYLRVSICVVSTRKAIRFSMNYGTELKQVVHTHWTSCRRGWPRGFGEINPNPRSWTNSWTSTSFSVDSSPRSYHSLSLRSERCQHSTSNSARRSFASLQNSRQNHRSYVWTEESQSRCIGLLLIQQIDINVPWSILLSTTGLRSKSSKSWWEISWIYILW